MERGNRDLSSPTEKINSIAIVLKSDIISSDKINNKFLQCKIPLVGYIKNDIFFIDLKAIPNDQIKYLIQTINEALK